MIQSAVQVGQRCGRWTVIAKSGAGHDKHGTWLCRCDCGTERSVRAAHLKLSKTKSCGCLRNEVTKRRNTRHGHSRSRTYTIWTSMHQRCSNEKSGDYRYYGARGISVCEEWMSYERFLNDMGEAPFGLSLDRIDNNKGYSKDNCRWATKKQQANNMRSNKRIEYNGRGYTVPELSEACGVNEQTLRQRLSRGLAVEDAVRIPLRTNKLQTELLDRKPDSGVGS